MSKVSAIHGRLGCVRLESTPAKRQKVQNRDASPQSCLLTCASTSSVEGAETARRDSVFVEPAVRPLSSLVLLFTSLLTIPLARQSCLYAALLAWLQVVGVTLDFLDDVLRLYLPLKPA